jgi:SAM-dependent methyltransferase
MGFDKKSTVEEFGNQFTVYNNIDGYWGSVEMLKDTVFPFDLNTIKNKKICEVGSGSGRIINKLNLFNPSKIVSIEPSKAIEVAKKNNKGSSIEFLNIRGQDLNFNEEFDHIFSLGVIHHIPEYEVVCKKIYKGLKPGGKFIIWVYGYENNQLYLRIFNNLRRVTRIIPDLLLRILSKFLNISAVFYIFLCSIFNMPLKDYFKNVFSKCSFKKREEIIFDQLNPSFAKYFKKEELLSLLKTSGFKNIEIHNRHNYSWTAIAEK